MEVLDSSPRPMPTEVTIKLTLAEAELLKCLVGVVGGHQFAPVRTKLATPMYVALDRLGVVGPRPGEVFESPLLTASEV